MLSLTALLLAAPVAVSATTVAAPTRHLRATRVSTPPVIDGVIEDAWKLAPSGDSFTQKFPKDGDVASDPTTVRVLYDDDAIYVAFDCPQPHTPVVKRLTRRDRSVEADSVTFDLGTRGDHKSTFEF